MKKKITQTLLPIIIGLLTMMQFACSDDNKSGGSGNGPLKLTTFYPDSGYLSSKIIIEGENMGTDASKLSVYFNKKKGFVSQAAGNILMVYAPKLPGDICDISVVKGTDSLTFDNKFRYISRFTVENICGKEGSGLSVGGDLASTTFENWKLKVGCCDPEGNYYACYSNFGGNTGGLALISEKNNLSKHITKIIVNDVVYHNETGKIYALATKRNIIYEIDPNNDWKAKARYLKLPGPPAKQVDYDRAACIAYCPANGYFYARTGTQQLFRFKLENMICEYVKDDKYNGAQTSEENHFILSMMFDPTDPTQLYTSYGSASCITVQDVSKPESEEVVYAGNFNVRADGDATQVINGYRTDCLFSWNNQMSIVSDDSGQKIMYVADSGTQTIRKIDMISGMVTIAVGRQKVQGNQSGTPLEATFNWPKGVGLTPEGDLYISDSGSGCIRKLSLR